MTVPWAPGEPDRILNVDDSDANRYARSRMLRMAGFRVDEAMTGRAALSLAGERPDLILLDVNLPDISGIEVCRQLRSDPATADIAVVHISATSIGTEDRIAGLDGGADAYLVEPVEPPELVAVVRALLRTRHAEEAARHAAVEAEAALRARDEFLASAAHELVGPISVASIRLQRADRLLDRGEVEPAREQARLAIRALNVLAEEVHALLDFGQAGGGITLRPAVVDLVQLVREVVDGASAEASETGASVRLELPDRPLVRRADPLRVRQVVRNLVSNAIRHGRGAPVSLTLSGDDQGVRIEVSDGGPGIAPADLERVFSPYVRLSSDRKGLGLGLTIVRSAVDAMEGTIDVRSTPGSGATFLVSLPLATVPA